MKKAFLLPATGLIAGSLLLATPLAPSANATDMVQIAQSSLESGPLPDTSLARPEYETQMQTYIDRTNDSIEELRTGTTSVTEDQLNDMTSSWQDIQTRWDESRAASDQDWPAARDSLNDSLGSFNDNFGGAMGGSLGNDTQ